MFPLLPFCLPPSHYLNSTKLFTKRLGCCGGKSQYVRFLPLCWPPSWYLNLVHFACSWAHYLSTAWRSSTKPFTKQLSLVEVSHWMFTVLPSYSPLSQYLNHVIACLLIWPTWVLFLYTSQVLLYSGKGQYNVHFLSTRRIFLWEDIPTM